MRPKINLTNYRVQEIGQGRKPKLMKKLKETSKERREMEAGIGRLLTKELTQVITTEVIMIIHKALLEKMEEKTCLTPSTISGINSQSLETAAWIRLQATIHRQSQATSETAKIFKLNSMILLWSLVLMESTSKAPYPKESQGSMLQIEREIRDKLAVPVQNI